MVYVIGIDSGSNYTKAVLMKDSSPISKAINPTGVSNISSIKQTMDQILKKNNLLRKDVSYVLVTGYGRVIAPDADKTLTEISCQAIGIKKLMPSTKTIIDIGGQDVKGIKLSDHTIVDFVYNDKCAAGTGRFLEVIAKVMGLPVDELGQISLKAKGKVPISSTCTVFAESEVVSHSASGVDKADIVAGIHNAFANRIYNLIGRLGIEKDVVVCGGCAMNAGLVKELNVVMGIDILVPEDPVFTCATGAAYIAEDELRARALEG